MKSHFAIVLLSLMAFVCFQICMPGIFGLPAEADNTIPLESNQVDGDVEAGGQNYAYNFTAGPGDVRISVDGKTDYYSSNVHITFSDDNGRELFTLAVPVDSDGSRKETILHLLRKQTVIMNVLLGTNVGVHLKYGIKLSGAVALDRSTNIASADVGRKSSNSPNLIDSSDAPKPRPGSPNQTKKSDEDTASEGKTNSGPIEDKWALVVGISKYQRPDINLKYSAKDARDLYQFLISEGNFAPDHVKLLVDEEATKEHVLEEIGDKWLPRLARPNDLVLIFVSCHGSPSQLDLEGLNYLVMYNTNPDSLYATGLPLQDLAAVIRQRVHAERVVVIIDACHSGAASPAKGMVRTGNFDGAALSQGTGQLVICSSKPDQVSWESKRYQNGVFTHQLIESLRKSPGKARLGDAFASLKESVLAEVLNDRKELQTPVLKSVWKGDDLVLAAPPSKPRAVPQE